MNDELFDEKVAVLNHDAGCSLFYSGGCTCDLNARRAKVEAEIEKHDAAHGTLTDEQYAEVLAAVRRGARVGTLHVDRWCDGSTACAVTSEPHGHWRGGYSVDGTEIVLRLLDEIKRLRGALYTVMGACDAECAACGAYYVAKKALDGTKEKP